MKVEHRVIIMDIQMPVMDGIEATLAIRNDQSGLFDPNTPILSLSANSLPEDLKRYKDVGINDCISKPITLDDLKTHLKTWIDFQNDSPN